MAADAPTPGVAATLLSLLSALWRFRRRVAIAAALLIASKLTFVAVPWALKRIVDLFSAPQPLLMLPVWTLLSYALLRLLGAVLGELRDLVYARVTQQAIADFTRRAFDHLHALGPRFHVSRQTGALVRDVERGTTAAGFLLGVGVLTIVPTIVEIIAIVIVLSVAYPWAFTGIIVATFASYAAVTAVLTERRVALQRQRNELDSSANTRLVDSLLNYETVKAHASERFESGRLGELLDRRRDVGLLTQRALSRLHVSQSGVIAAGVAAVMLLAGQRVLSGTLTVGDLVLINAYVIQICLPLNTLGFVFREVRDALVNAERLFTLFRQQPDIEETPRTRALADGRGEVRFEQVRFGYDPARPILHDVSFTIAPGATVAVVGGSGSGKSTLARLLLRFYDPWSGRVLVDGEDIRSVSQPSLRGRIGVVPQDTALFNDSIAYNIGYGRQGATLADIIAAARAAHVHEFITTLPDGYDTRVGERGLKLSGGEKQRIAIARAMIRDPLILVLDEATSALDTRSERAIQSELDRLSSDRTTLVIAHRLSTVVNADEILVLEHGRVVERGHHDELLARGADGIYAQLWALQERQHALERTEQRLAVQPINLAAMLAGIIDGLRGDLEARGVTLYGAIDADSARISGDPAGLQQVLWQLAAQTAESCDAGGRVELRLERAGTQARISIVGLAAVAPTPLHSTPVDTLQARSTVELNHGRLEIIDGTALPQYRIELPLRAVATEARPSSAATAAPDRSALVGIRVLAVDDRREALEVLREVLVAHGAEVMAEDSGGAALKRLATAPAEQWPQLLICDIALGEHEDGYGVVRALRELEAQRGVTLGRRMPAIALTGLAESDARMRSLMAGYQLHLAKPVAAHELIVAVAALAHPA